jgi:hypothetical protein
MMANNLERLHSQQNGMAEAPREYQYWLKIDREQAQKNRQETVPDLTSTERLLASSFLGSAVR